MSFLITATACHHWSSTPPRIAHKSAVHLLNTEKEKEDASPKKTEQESLHGHRRLQKNAFYIIASTKYILWIVTVLELSSYILSFPGLPADAKNALLPTLLPGRSGSPPLLDTVAPYSSLLFWPCVLSIISGYLLRRQCFIVMGRHFTFSHTTLKDHRLITGGPYSVVRHPSYTGEALVRLGAAVLVCRPGGYIMQSGALSLLGFTSGLGELSLSQLALLSTLRLGLVVFLGWISFALPYLAIRSSHEDATLSESFGEQWDEYAKRVPWKFVPYIV